jgi:hypothetical protein
MISNQFQSLLMKYYETSTGNQNGARLAGRAASAHSMRGLAGAARAERRALPAWLPSDNSTQLRRFPVISNDFQSIPINSNHFWKKYEDTSTGYAIDDL